jgi:hypothetical protein
MMDVEAKIHEQKMRKKGEHEAIIDEIYLPSAVALDHGARCLIKPELIDVLHTILIHPRIDHLVGARFLKSVLCSVDSLAGKTHCVRTRALIPTAIHLRKHTVNFRPKVAITGPFH